MQRCDSLGASLLKWRQLSRLSLLLMMVIKGPVGNRYQMQSKEQIYVLRVLLFFFFFKPPSKVTTGVNSENRSFCLDDHCHRQCLWMNVEVN